jgi:hypothetical protein
MLTIIYPYFNSIKAVKIQIDNWSQYPIELMKKLHFILIDDCSDSKTEESRRNWCLNLCCIVLDFLRSSFLNRPYHKMNMQSP